MKITVAGPCLPMLLTALLLAACAPGPRVELRPASEVMSDTTYTLILHGCNFGNDPATVAFLRREDQPYTLTPYSPEFQYRLHSGLKADKALAQARDFVNCSPHFSHSSLRGILGPAGELIGYELRPSYQPLFFRWRDLLDISYSLRAERVVIYITPQLLDDDYDDHE
ncbi:hypothetical protein ACHHRT_04015 [Desulfurivibrio sp. D14AmB]|uniref:hypothetical protein n=1 Tax=Desulfurivibrio sp. D14AmB TaxID=3374370 RepID=UPI00376EE333